jgi:Zn-dependent protease with chaperone function
VAVRASYRLWFLAITACTLLIITQSFAGGNPLSGERRTEPVPDSPRKQSIMNMARLAGVNQINLRIRNDADYGGEMNAWGTDQKLGAEIEFSKSFWDVQDDAAILGTTGHELFHVLHDNSYTFWASICWAGAVLTCFLIGFPKGTRVEGHNPLRRIPVYVMILVLLSPAVRITQNALKRPNEAQADVYGIRLAVGNKLISLEQAKGSLLRSHEFSLLDPDPAWLFKILLYDHPPLVERLRNIDEAVKEMQTETMRR